MFVPTTRRGLLTTMLKEQEDKLSNMTGFRVKYQEAGGVQMGKLFSTDLARDQPCGRDQCWPCLTKKEGESKKCRDRSVLYVTSCSLCNPGVDETSQVDNNKEVPRVVNMNVADPSPSSKGRVGIYLGETSRSLHERAKEHVNDAASIQPKSHIVKHWLDAHPELNNPPPFKFTVQKGFKDALSRQLGEAIAIHKSKDSLLNSKNEYVTNCISRITVQEGAIERKIRDRREEEEEKEEELRILIFKKDKLEVRALVAGGGRDELEVVRRARTTSGTEHQTSQVEKDCQPEGWNGGRLEKGRRRLEELRQRLEVEKSEVLSKMCNQKFRKNQINSVQMPGNLTATSSGVCTSETTPTQRLGEHGSEEGACTTSTLLRNITTPHQLTPILNSGSKRKHLHTFQAGEMESDSPRKKFKRILNFWGNTTQPEPNSAKPR
jgi:hypothetical protein